MTQSYASSLVFVGTFPTGMFDERELFDGRIDPGRRLDIGPVLQCSYASGKYQFLATPERVDLKANVPEIVPDALVGAARIIVAGIEGVRRAVQVSGFGMNCDTVFDRHSVGARGADYCSKLMDPKIATLVDAESLNALTKVQFEKGAFRYEVRLEPHFNSLGDGLFVAVNGHQDVDRTESLNDKIEQTDVFRAYIENLHQRIENTERST